MAELLPGAKYRRGAFLNLTSFDPPNWQLQLADLDAMSGLDHLEVWLEFAPAPRELSLLAEMLEGRETIMHGPFIGLSLATNWDQLMEISFDRCRQAVEAAGYIGCQVVTLHGGIFPGYSGHDRALRRLTANLERLNLSRRPVVSVENLPAKRGASWESVCYLEELEALAQTTDLCFTLDVGHCLQNHEDPLPFLAKYASRVANIHLHDGKVGGRAHHRLGSGDLDLDGLLKALHEYDYDGFLTLETIGVDDTQASWEYLCAAERRLGATATA